MEKSSHRYTNEDAGSSKGKDASIAKELRARLTDELDQPSVEIDYDAYSLYLKGRGLVAKRKQAELLEGIEILESALEIAPEYAPAMATKIC